MDGDPKPRASLDRGIANASVDRAIVLAFAAPAVVAGVSSVVALLGAESVGPTQGLKLFAAIVWACAILRPAWRAMLTGIGRLLGGIDQTISAHPYVVMRLRQIRHDVAPALVGDRNLREAGAELTGLRDDPHAGFGTEAARDDAADVIIVDFDGRSRVLLRA